MFLLWREIIFGNPPDWPYSTDTVGVSGLGLFKIFLNFRLLESSASRLGEFIRDRVAA